MEPTFSYKHLVFEGGGVKGVAYAKIPRALEEFGILQNIKKIAGSSAGAIIALLLALRYSPEEIEALIKKTDFKKFKDPLPFYTSKVFNLLLYSGIYSGKRFEKWIKSQIVFKTGSRDTTFKQLYDKTGIELVLTGTCLKSRKTEYFSYKTKPDMPVWLACRISMSIPCYYFPVSVDWVKYVDGGLLYNYPIWVFDHPNTYEFRYGNLNLFNESTLGFKFVSNCDSDFASTIPSYRVPLLRTLIDLIATMITHIDSGYAHKSYWDRTVGLNTEDVKTTDFDLPEEKKQKVIENAYLITKKYLANKLKAHMECV